MAKSTVLGYPRIGAKRELKRALEGYWKGKLSASELTTLAGELRVANWQTLRQAGVDVIPSNDSSLYDHVLDMVVLLGAVPERYQHISDPLDRYFAMARGEADGAPAMEMTKWFDTNYHYIVAEIEEETRFALSDDKPVREYLEAKQLGIETRPVILGPVSFLSLSKSRSGAAPLSRLSSLLPVYTELLEALADAGASWVQIDEPVLATDLTEEQQRAFRSSYDALAAGDTRRPKIMLASYFGPLDENGAIAAQLPVEGVHLDLTRGGSDREKLLPELAARGKRVSLGLIDGRNIWKADLKKGVSLAEEAVAAVGTEGVEISSSCSLLHVPVDLRWEERLNPEIRDWLAFARQKLDELVAITTAVGPGKEAVQQILSEQERSARRRRESNLREIPEVQHALGAITDEMSRRPLPFAQRYEAQQRSLELPLFPTTTIGSFPQTSEIRTKRAALKKGEIDQSAYEEFLKEEIRRVVSFQEEIDLDVLVHGEPERNDMVEYFGEQLEGFASTDNGWVQSYGSRCVKPPIIYGDLRRRGPMTVAWSTYAQSLTERVMKGMLTGPVTILRWSFVRDDQSEEQTATQIALAIREEVSDLEAAGIKVIQIDEPAFREGLPLRQSRRSAYLDWATRVFRLATSSVATETQIHTHMCYSEFNDIISAIAALDADVISIESSRSDMELLDAFSRFRYPNAIGPGVYDLHSPPVPPVEPMEAPPEKAVEVMDARQLWVNPDCGLKTRGWRETREALSNMVAAAKRLREKRG